jgi:hypothetical protein
LKKGDSYSGSFNLTGLRTAILHLKDYDRGNKEEDGNGDVG